MLNRYSLKSTPKSGAVMVAYLDLLGWAKPQEHL